MKKYRVNGLVLSIQYLEVLKETAKMITYQPKHDKFFSPEELKPKTQKKDSYWVKWFDTWDEAYAYILRRAKAKVRVVKELLKVLDMKEVK